jgi:DNA double-strand break repair helicase HerA and related ATPase
VIKASPVAGEYDERVDRKSAYEILQKKTAERAEATEDAAEAKTARKSGGGSRSDSFWMTLWKTIVRTGVPMATRVLEDAIKRNALGGISRRR